jgi:hypothetical protein
MLNGAETTFTVPKNGAEACFTETFELGEGTFFLLD